MGVKMGWIQIKMGHPLARNGAALAPFRANGAHPSIMQPLKLLVTPCAHARARGYVIGRGVYILLYICKKISNFFSIFQNTHFHTPISTQEGFSSNLIASSIP